MDPLRVIGLRTLLDRQREGKHVPTEIMPLSAPRALETVGLTIVLIDSDSTPFLLELLSTFRRARPELNVIVLGSSMDPAHIEGVIGAGAKGYLRHSASEDELRMAIDTVSDGSVWAPRKVMARLVTGSRPTVSGAQVKLTARESQVLELLVQGYSNREIALELAIDEGTVKAHLGRLMRKTGVTNRTALTMQTLTKIPTQTKP
ncbi:response regulator transcription factor [Granulicella sp. WH15]|uniref:response regulator transcription factor n=1 Tax=Granulicella sp. WH15 TaxID=2602070 RepID=UPI00210755D8|nr:response regulator transcription factor [Granulicella sp. WH15]